MRLKGKVAIVTGAGSGFGAGIARRFAEEGAKVVVNDINTQAGEKVAKEVNGPVEPSGTTHPSAPTLATVFWTSTRKLLASPVRSSAIASTTPAPITAIRNCR